jgi:hypothetical protein
METYVIMRILDVNRATLIIHNMERVHSKLFYGDIIMRMFHHFGIIVTMPAESYIHTKPINIITYCHILKEYEQDEESEEDNDEDEAEEIFEFKKYDPTNMEQLYDHISKH